MSSRSLRACSRGASAAQTGSKTSRARGRSLSSTASRSRARASSRRAVSRCSRALATVAAPRAAQGGSPPDGRWRAGGIRGNRRASSSPYTAPPSRPLWPFRGRVGGMGPTRPVRRTCVAMSANGPAIHRHRGQNRPIRPPNHHQVPRNRCECAQPLQIVEALLPDHSNYCTE